LELRQGSDLRSCDRSTKRQIFGAESVSSGDSANGARGMMRFLDWLGGFVLDGAKWLALPVVCLLFLQWPLRAVFGLYSREANDLGQWLFALYVAASIAAATRAGTHLAADTVARHYSAATREWLTRAGAVFGLIPWSIIVLFTGWSIVRDSTLLFERFPDTGNPGYFIIKLALLLMALLVLIEGVLELLAPPWRPRPQ
jgi:TRAP-type mannitol/chloroaromatic compound transport system permease small subunit